MISIQRYIFLNKKLLMKILKNSFAHIFQAIKKSFKETGVIDKINRPRFLPPGNIYICQPPSFLKSVGSAHDFTTSYYKHVYSHAQEEVYRLCKCPLYK